MNSVPSAKVAAAALHQVKQASECFPTSYQDTEKAAKAKVHLQVATELLALIAEDGGVTALASPFPAPPPLRAPIDDMDV